MGSLLTHFLSHDTTTQTVLLVATSIVGILLLNTLFKKLTGPNLPPGPMPLPIIGNILQLGARPKNAHITFNELANRYGDVYLVKIFSQKLVVLSSYEAMREAFVKHADVFSNRDVGFLPDLTSKGGNGVVWQRGDTWKPVRRFVLSSLRDFGFGKRSMDGRILEEATALCKVFANKQGKAFEPLQIVSEASSNIICSICFGSRFEYTDKLFQKLIHMIAQSLSEVGMINPVDYFTFLQWFPLPSKLQRALTNFDEVNVFINDQIEEHRASYDENNLRDFIDLYIKKEKEHHGDDPVFSTTNIKIVIRDLFVAGSDTTSNTISWALLYIINFPKIQDRLDKEIEQVVGRGREPTITDKPDLIYLQAFILEIWRHVSIAPMVLPHTCLEDRVINGYTIPKGATVLGDVYSVHRSEKYWKNPKVFQPERFVDADGKLKNIKEGFLPFGIGPRQCLGETMARTQVFLILATLIQNFTFKAVDEKNPPPLQGQYGTTLGPDPFQIRAIPK